MRELAKATALYDNIVVLHCAGFDRELRGLWHIERETDPSLAEGIVTYRLWWRLSPIPKTSFLLMAWSVLLANRHIAKHGFQPDVIHAHVYDAGAVAVLAGMLQHVPVVVTEHFSAFALGLVTGVEAWKARLAFGGADRVITVSEALRHTIQAQGFDGFFCVVPNVVDTSLFYADPSAKSMSDPKHLLFVGLLDPSHKKGVPQLLAALAGLLRRRSDWHLDIVGDGPARPEYERLVVELGLRGHVSFHGERLKREVAALMRQAAICVVPSLYETFSVVAAEALSSGTPILATRPGGPEEFIDESAGVLVPSGDVQALCAALDAMLEDLRRFSPQSISRSAERFGPRQVGAQLHAIYGEVTGKASEVFSVGHSGYRAFIKDGWSVLDVGSGHHPHPRATVLLDRDLGPHRERSGKSAVLDARPLVVADAESLPFTNYAFDYVIASHVAEHLADPVRFCRELARVARSGYIECPGPLSELALGEPFHRWVVQKRGDTLVFRPKPRKPWFVRYLSDAFYALFYAGQQRARPTFRPRSHWGIQAAAKMRPFFQRVWSSRLLRRRTWTCFPFVGEFVVEVREG